MRVLALDPGERVGWATGTIEDRVWPVGRATGIGVNWDLNATLPPPTQLQVETFKAFTVEGHGIAYLKDMAMAVYRSVVLEKKYDVVVCEKWELTAKGAKVLLGSDLQWCQFIGMVRLCCWLSGTKYVGQPPSAMRSARRSLRGPHASAADVLERVAKADAVSHDDGHDGSALLHLWHYYFEEFV